MRKEVEKKMNSLGKLSLGSLEVNIKKKPDKPINYERAYASYLKRYATESTKRSLSKPLTMSEFKGMYTSIKATNPKGVHRAIIQTQRQISPTQLTAAVAVMKSLKDKKYYQREGMFGSYTPDDLDGTPRGDVAREIVEWAFKNKSVNEIVKKMKISPYNPFEDDDEFNSDYDFMSEYNRWSADDRDEDWFRTDMYNYLIKKVAKQMNATNTRQIFGKMNREEIGKFFATAKLAMGLTSSQFNSMIDSPTDYSVFAMAASMAEAI